MVLMSTGHSGYMKRWVLVKQTRCKKFRWPVLSDKSTLSKLMNFMSRNSYCQRAMHSRGKSAIQWDNPQPLFLATTSMEKFPKANWYHNHNYSKKLPRLSISKPHCNTILFRHLIDLISF